MQTRKRSALKKQNIFHEEGILQPSSTNKSIFKLFDLKSAAKLVTPEFSFERVDTARVKPGHHELVSTNEGGNGSIFKRDLGESELRMGTKDSWARFLEEGGHGFVSDLRGNSSIKKSSMAAAERNTRHISDFDDVPMIKIEYVEEKEAPPVLGKRSRGRPSKEVAKAYAEAQRAKEERMPKPILEGYVYKGPDPLGFESDAEQVALELTPKELRDEKLVFSFGSQKFYENGKSATRGQQPFSLDFQRLISMIRFYDDQNKFRQFMCKFCGKCFDKPSSLGGHTAKSHYGLSIKYRNRLHAALSRQAERKRLQYLKNELPKAYGIDNDGKKLN